jgi:hypothetical protein
VTTSALRRALPALSVVLFVGGLQAADKAPSQEIAALINRHLSQAWQENNLQPAPRTSDLEFLRRSTLHLTGRIPTLEEAEAFEKDPAADKRARWVERLLAGPEYPEHWARLWNRWVFAGTVVHPVYRDQLQGWLKQQFARNVSHKDLATQLLTATGKSSENPAVHFVLANLGGEVPADKRDKDGQFTAEPVTFRSFSLFLGYQIACIQCHCHPFNPEWKQPQFWQLNAFFRQVERKGTPAAPDAPVGTAPVLELLDNPAFNKNGMTYYEKRNGMWLATEAKFLGHPLPRDWKGTRREDFARRLTVHDNFSKALVNRLWGHFFGRGLNVRTTVDDFGEHNEVVHPELLAQIAKAFAAAGHDYKQLIRAICASDAYQLRSTANLSNEPEEAEAYFSRMLAPPLSFDAMFDSVWTAARLGDVLGGGGKESLRKKWRKFLHAEFTEEVTFFPPLPETDPWRRMLLLMNNEEIHDALNDTTKGIMKAVREGGNPEKIADALYLTVLTRHPTSAEKKRLDQEINAERQRSKDGDLSALWQDLFWALLNSNEFIVNH